MIDASLLRRFNDLIRARSGLNMRAQEAHLLLQTLQSRIQALHFSTPTNYFDLLDSDSPGARQEWKHLFGVLTNQESYFFRDPGQLAVIREHVLPELIQQRRDTRTLRIWSAACSTGEEPYSLAMMLDDVLPSREGWRILILGTDLSAPAIERAQRGVYGSWSFRTQDNEIQERYFIPRGDQWEVQPGLRQNVKFATGNLLDDDFPARASEIHDMDLIVCRNVFIYFARDAVTRVLRKFSATLRPEGYLVTGHAELHDVPLGDLQIHSFPQSVVYQRARTVAQTVKPAGIPAQGRLVKPEPLAPARPGLSTTPPAKVPPKNAAGPLATPVTSARGPAPSVPTLAVTARLPTITATDAAGTITETTAMIRSGRYAVALERLQSLLEREPRNLAALCLVAQAQANAGQLEKAEANCRLAIEVSSFAALPYHVLARVAAERGDDEAAKALLKKVIYLVPSSVWSYLEMVALYTREGDTKRAAQMQRSALEILDGLSDDALVPAEEFSIEESLTAGELKRRLQSNDAE